MEKHLKPHNQSSPIFRSKHVASEKIILEPKVQSEMGDSSQIKIKRYVCKTKNSRATGLVFYLHFSRQDFLCNAQPKLAMPSTLPNTKLIQCSSVLQEHRQSLSYIVAATRQVLFQFTKLLSHSSIGNKNPDNDMWLELQANAR